MGHLLYLSVGNTLKMKYVDRTSVLVISPNITKRHAGKGMADKKRIVIAEAHTILREGLKALLSSDPGLEIVGEAQDGIEAIRRVGELSPDLIMIDLTMPRMNGMEAIREIKRTN